MFSFPEKGGYMSEQTERMLRLGEVETRLAISRWTIYDWIRSGTIHAMRLPSGYFRIPESEVERILQEREPTPA